MAFALNGGAVSLGASAKLTMTLYQYVASSDSWRKCASTTSQTGKNGSFEMLLGAGSYKVAVSGGTAKNAAEYTLTSTVARTVTMLAFAQGAATSGAGHVGAAGSLDYYAFTVKQSNADGATAGKYTFALTAGSFTSGNAAVTLYRTWADGSIQKVKSLTVTDRNLSFSVGDLLEGTYYVAVESVKGKESDYTLTVTADDTYDRLTDGVPGAIDRNQYASFTVGNAEDNYVLEFTGAKYTVYTDNGKGGFAAVSTVKGRAVVDGGTTLYIKSTADANPITVDELVGYSAEGGVLTIGTAATGWVGGSNAEDTWTVAGYGDGWSKFTVDLTGSLDNTARLTFTINQLVNGVWRKYASCTGQSGKTASFGVSLDPGTAYQLVVSGGTARNAAAYTVTGTEYLYDYSNNLFEDATVLSAGDTVADKVLVKNFDDVDFYDLGNLADGNLFSWQQSEGSAKLSFYDENYKLVAVTADITDSKGVVSKKANTFTLSAAVSLAFDDYSASGVKYVKAEAAANGGSIYQLALGA